MLSDEELAHLEGAKNLWRYNRSDLINTAVYVGFVLAVLGAGWVLLHLVGGHPFNPCGTLNPTCALHPVHLRAPHVSGPTIPAFRP